MNMDDLAAGTPAIVDGEPAQEAAPGQAHQLSMVSTFSVRGMGEYGIRMVESFLRNWPQDVHLRLYTEGWQLPDRGSRLKQMPLHQSAPWLAAFAERNRHRNRTQGYRHDAIRFSYKIGAMLHAMTTSSTRWIGWIDGDVYTHSPVPMSALRDMLPRDPAWISMLRRRHIYSECGFWIVDTHHPRHWEMVERLRAMYQDDLLWRLPEWHDSYVMDTIIRQAGVAHHSLSGEAGERTGHPMINGPLGEWFDHLKGARKQAGRSYRVDLVVERAERYWNP